MSEKIEKIVGLKSNNGMTIRDIYEKYTVPPNLVEHMSTVADVVETVKQYWSGPNLDWGILIRAALLHDIGNIVKFDFVAHPEFMGVEAGNIAYWKEVQDRIIDIYGRDDHVAGGKMLQEAAVADEIVDLIQNKSFSNAVAVAEGDDWQAKILFYADMRVMPHGIVSLEERLADVCSRMPQYTSRPDFEDLLNGARNIETQITAVVNVPLSEIQWRRDSTRDRERLLLSVLPSIEPEI